MSASISQKKEWVITQEAFDRMLAELHPDSERTGEQSHCFYEIIDDVSGCLYPQTRHTFPPALREAFKQQNLQHNQTPPWIFSTVGLPGYTKTP